MSARLAKRSLCSRVSRSDINAPRMTWKQIAVSIGTSEESVRQMHSIALAKMRKSLLELLASSRRGLVDADTGGVR